VGTGPCRISAGGNPAKHFLAVAEPAWKEQGIRTCSRGAQGDDIAALVRPYKMVAVVIASQHHGSQQPDQGDSKATADPNRSGVQYPAYYRRNGTGPGMSPD
jgi:hypothetical protein